MDTKLITAYNEFRENHPPQSNIIERRSGMNEKEIERAIQDQAVFYQVFDQYEGNLNIDERDRIERIRPAQRFIGECFDHRFYFTLARNILYEGVFGGMFRASKSTTPIEREAERVLEELVLLPDVGDAFRDHFEYTSFQIQGTQADAVEGMIGLGAVSYQERGAHRMLQAIRPNIPIEQRGKDRIEDYYPGTDIVS